MLPDWFQQLGLMAWPLTDCSIIILMISIERLCFHVVAFVNQDKHYSKLSDYLCEHQFLPKASRDELVEMMSQELQSRYFNGAKMLRMVGTSSPIVGLLGTILDIIAAFKVIAAQTGSVSPGMISDGLWKAMLTTEAGLMIALPALLLAYLFRFLAGKQINRLCLKLNQLSISFEIDRYSEQEKDSYRNNVERLSA